uniref:Uncharacterized protein n=1 Tax=Cajanus cajan TaxID=3821 RepID=A0A151T9D6_CAJCA|nr:hypothetical protein KK1_018224 [Cajanus cajan]
MPQDGLCLISDRHILIISTYSQPRSGSSKGRPKSSRIHIKMDLREKGQLKCCSFCQTLGYSKNKCLHCPKNSNLLQ